MHVLWMREATTGEFPGKIGEYDWPDRDAKAYTIMCHRSLQKITVRTRTDLRHLMGCMDLNGSFGAMRYARIAPVSTCEEAGGPWSMGLCLTFTN